MENVCIGMIGAGRAAELHMDGLARVSGVPVRKKTIVARNLLHLKAINKRFGFERISLDIDDVVNDKEINVVDICAPPYIHEDIIIRVLNAGKHVICEKPLTGYFGYMGDPTQIGNHVTKSLMFERLMQSLERLSLVISSSPGKFMYAENFIYAPAIIKAADIIIAKKSRILFMIGEESLNGSSSPVAGDWSKTGGGAFIRVGTHPLTTALWLKAQEAKALGINISVESVIADMGRLSPALSFYEHRHLSTQPVDVEDCGTAMLTFTDKSKALIIATDFCLGGSKNYLNLYCNDMQIKCTLTANDLMDLYLLDEDGMSNVNISELTNAKTGWNKPFIADSEIRGYNGEMQDFMDSVFYDREPKCGYELAHDTIKTIYMAYMSAEFGKRIIN